MKSHLIFLISLTAASLLTAQTDAEALYKNKCLSCHGSHGEKKALNASKLLHTLNEEEITKALSGYKDGTYDGRFKGIKRGLASKLSTEDIYALAAYIKTLKP